MRSQGRKLSLVYSKTPTARAAVCRVTHSPMDGQPLPGQSGQPQEALARTPRQRGLGHWQACLQKALGHEDMTRGHV